MMTGQSSVLLDYSCHRLKAFRDETEKIANSEFAYDDAKLALSKLQTLFDAKLSRLELFDAASDPDVVLQECRQSIVAIATYLPLLGFLLRSTNVRNAFEIVGPLKRLARALLDGGGANVTRVVVSSEWNYSPFVFRGFPELPDFVLIGLPANDSSNPFVLPLAGHELGHAVWKKAELLKSFRRDINTAITDYITHRWPVYQSVFPTGATKPTELTSTLPGLESWRAASQWALRQAEETFCDFVGVGLFGRSFLQAFAYLLSPGLGTRPPEYPSLVDRVNNLIWSCTKSGSVVPDGYADLFGTNTSSASASAQHAFLLDAADASLAAVRDSLWATADQRLQAAGVALPGAVEIDRIADRLALVLPAEHCGSLPAIAAAGWKLREKPDLWSRYPEVYPRRDLVLKELLLKTIEVFEIEQILGSK